MPDQFLVFSEKLRGIVTDQLRGATSCTATRRRHYMYPNYVISMAHMLQLQAGIFGFEHGNIDPELLSVRECDVSVKLICRHGIAKLDLPCSLYRILCPIQRPGLARV